MLRLYVFLQTIDAVPHNRLQFKNDSWLGRQRIADSGGNRVHPGDCILDSSSNAAMRVLEFMPATRKILRLLASEPAEFAEQYGVRLHEVAQTVAQHSL